MERPNVPAMDQIEAVLKNIKDLEESIQLLKEKLKELPAEMSQQLNSEDERIAAARYLYWLMPEVSSSAVAKSFFNTSAYRLREIVGEAVGAMTCERCNKNIQFRDRSHLQESIRNFKKGLTHHTESYAIICDCCREDLQTIHREECEQIESERKNRIQDLKSMPYYQYLQTPEWQEKRKQHLKSVGYRCQVCNTGGVTLNVHHRTYVRRGAEWNKDLVVLCHSCHELFHSEGRLAE